MPSRIRINWTASNGSPGGVSSLFVNAGTSIIDIYTRVDNLLTQWANVAANDWSGELDPEMQSFRESDGQLIGVSRPFPGNAKHTGAIAGEPVADATAGLLQFYTGGIVNGHRVRGRIFLPGLAADGLIGGQWAPLTMGALNNAAGQWASLAGSAVWSRPVKGGRPGSMHEITAGGGWEQCAVLRSRRQR